VGRGKAANDVDQTREITNTVVNITLLIMFPCSAAEWATMASRPPEKIFRILTGHFVSALAFYAPRVSAIEGFAPCPGPEGVETGDVFSWHGEPRLVQFGMILTSDLPERFCTVVLSLYEAKRHNWGWSTDLEGPVDNLLFGAQTPVYPEDEDGQRTDDESYGALEIAMDGDPNVYFRFGVGPGSRGGYFAYGDAELAEQRRTRLAYVLDYGNAGMHEKLRSRVHPAVHGHAHSDL
jgi:hypothetical protein